MDKYLDKILGAAVLGRVPELRQLGGDYDLGQHVGQLGLRLAVDGSRTVDRHDLQNRSRVDGEKEHFAESAFADLFSRNRKIVDGRELGDQKT